MLEQLQAHLAAIYRADCGYSITDFVVTDRRLAATLGSAPLPESVDETVFIMEANDELSLSVYIDHELLERLGSDTSVAASSSRHLSDLAVVLEGISHFNYIGWNANQNKSVTRLELELQAEIDKFVATLFLSKHPVDAMSARQLHERLFDDYRLQESLSAEAMRRYETASDYAARFCHQLYERMSADSDLNELRYFYRLSAPEKFSHIHSLLFG